MVRAVWSFARAPLVWGSAIALVFLPLAFAAQVDGEKLPSCTDWFWCDYPVKSMRLTATPEASSFLLLLVIPAAFIVFLAARIANRGPTKHAAWFMAGPMIAFFGLSIAFLIEPWMFVFLFRFPFWIDVEHSDPVVARFVALHDALPFNGLIALGLALVTLMGAVGWRLLAPHNVVTAPT